MKHRLRKKLALTVRFAESLKNAAREEYVLRLYIAGMTPRSVEAFSSVKRTCEKHVQGRYELEVIDIYRQPFPFPNEQLLACPMLVRTQPAPVRRLIGDLSEEDRVLTCLDLRRTS
jgi:circadian clock protein KaiB